MVGIVLYGISIASVWAILLWGRDRKQRLAVGIIAGVSAAAMHMIGESLQQHFRLEYWIFAAEQILCNLLLAACLSYIAVRLRTVKREEGLSFAFRAAALQALVSTACKPVDSWSWASVTVVSLLIIALVFLEKKTNQYLSGNSVPQQDPSISTGRFSELLPYIVEDAACLLVAVGLEASGPVKTWVGGSLFVFGLLLCWISRWLGIYLQAYQSLKCQLQDERQYRDKMQSFVNMIRSQRHDFNFHVQALAQMFREGDTEKCEEYIDFLQQDTADVNAVLPVKEVAIASVLNMFQILARREGIVLHIDIQDDLSQVVTNVYETNKIIGNLLQNAIEEVKTHADKSYGIRLYIFKRDQYAVIRVSNELEKQQIGLENLNQLFKHAYTTKTGHEGIGLSSVRSLLVSRKGLITIKMEGKVIHFIARIPVQTYVGNDSAQSVR